MNDTGNSNSFEQPAWIAQAKQLLDESARDLDANTASRLNRARQRALAQSSRRLPRLWLVPAGLAGVCALLLVVAIWQPHHAIPRPAVVPVGPNSEEVNAADSEAPAIDDAVEFYQNLEFYAWLDAQGKDGDG